MVAGDIVPGSGWGRSRSAPPAHPRARTANGGQPPDVSRSLCRYGQRLPHRSDHHHQALVWLGVTGMARYYRCPG